MIEALDRAWRNADRLKRVTSVARDLYRRPLLPDELSKFGAAIIDPALGPGPRPRRSRLSRSGLPVIAFVSCNPVTFARDAKLLIEAGYSLDWVQVVDQFRWSSHVELVGKFSRTSG